MEEKASAAKKFIEWLNRRYTLLERIMSWVVAIASLVVGIIAMTSGKMSWAFVITIVIVDSVLLVIFGAVSMILMIRNEHSQDLVSLKHKAEIDELEKVWATRFEEARAERDDNKARVNVYEETQSKLLLGYSTLVSQQTINTKDLERSIDRFYQSIDSAAQCMEKATAGQEQGTPEVVSNLSAEVAGGAYRSIKKDTITATNRFFRQMVEGVKAMVEDYLETKGVRYEVSVALKMYLQPAGRGETLKAAEEANIYTAFRDPQSWSKKQQFDRPPGLHSAARNTDFRCCVSGDKYFVFNNKERGADYANSSPNFGSFYNCGATVLVASAGLDAADDGFVYGFLACDVKNDDASVEPIDENVARILLTVGDVIALYIENASAVWNYAMIFGKEVLDDLFPYEENFFEMFYHYLGGEKANV